MKLTAENVNKVFFGCMYKEEIKKESDIPHGAIIVEGIASTVVFDPVNVESSKEDIKELLTQIPDDFSSKEAGGTSFMNLPALKNGEMWGEQRNAEQLMFLGIAARYMKYLVPPEAWKNLPGGMPYLFVSFDENAPEESSDAV